MLGFKGLTVSGAPLDNILCLMQLDLSFHVFNIYFNLCFDVYATLP